MPNSVYTDTKVRISIDITDGYYSTQTSYFSSNTSRTCPYINPQSDRRHRRAPVDHYNGGIMVQSCRYPRWPGNGSLGIRSNASEESSHSGWAYRQRRLADRLQTLRRVHPSDHTEELPPGRRSPRRPERTVTGLGWMVCLRLCAVGGSYIVLASRINLSMLNK